MVLFGKFLPVDALYSLPLLSANTTTFPHKSIYLRERNPFHKNALYASTIPYFLLTDSV